MSSHESPGSQAEDFLIEEGAFARRSQPRRNVLACLACRFAASIVETAEAEASENDIITCAPASANSLERILKELEIAGFVASRPDPAHDALPTRHIYSPADNEQGRALADELLAPELCGLDTV